MKGIWVKKCLVVGIILIFSEPCIIAVIAQNNEKSQPISRSQWLYVGGSGPGNYTKIQDAIDSATDGDTVFVYRNSSPYFETIRIDRSIHLIGEDKNVTELYGDRINSTIYGTADDITISGFSIQNSGRFYPNAGIYLTGSDHSTISQNIIKNNMIHGILLLDSTYVSISENIIQQNDEFGIGLIGETTNNITIELNKIQYNYAGVVGISTDNILVYGNSIVYNEIVGVFFENSRNIVGYHNDVISKLTNAHDNYSPNKWENETYGGNYWGGYQGIDANGDGIGDTPYSFDFNSDNYPLMKPVYGLYVDGGGPYLSSINSVVEFNTDVHGGQFPYEWWWDFDDGDTSSEMNPLHIYETPGIYDAQVTVIDIFNQSSTNIVTVKISHPPETTMYVDDDYTASTPGWNFDHFSEIQDGIDLCGIYGSVLVQPGLYCDSGYKRSVLIFASPYDDSQYITLNKPITLRGAGNNTSILDGSGKASIVEITAEKVTLSGFLIRGYVSGVWGVHCHADNCVISYNTIIGEGRCIIVRGNHIQIFGNELTSTDDSALEIWGCMDVDVFRNNITNTSNPFDLMLNERIKIHENNFMSYFIRIYWVDLLSTFFSPFKKTRFYQNYWYRSRVLPKIFIALGMMYLTYPVPLPIPMIQFDFFPAKQPYDIEGFI